MRKSELFKVIEEQTGVSHLDVMLVLESYFRAIKVSLKRNESVYIRGFGTFLNKKKASKKARIIHQNKEILLPACFKPYFRPSKCFTAMIKKLKTD